MDDVDILAELEVMASLALDQPKDAEPLPADVQRWQRLFGYTHDEAVSKIKRHRSNLTRTVIDSSQWENIRVMMERLGYDKETFEYTYHRPDIEMEVPPEMSHHAANLLKFGSAKYLVKLEPPIDSPESIRCLGLMPNAPEVFRATNEDGYTADFCPIGEKAKFLILQHFRQIKSTFQPTIIRYNVAEKDLSKTSIHPTLGCDATLPQNRATGDDDERLLPAQDQYPVWYFFYGKLADADVLRELLGGEADYRKASIKGGVLKTWGGKYKALVNAPDGKAPRVKGKAFLVMDKELEDALRTYETDKYEVTRCLIEMADTIAEVRGLTFRFAGEADEVEK
ncbi:poly polymerase [Colletotrichum camelliae]|nr:poly polymerase [Colletotrichum camelliae]